MQHQVDLVIDGGHCGLETTTVVNLEEDYPVIVRAGMGDTSLFG
jgi:tRNA A37 threonylcarbamoyladenosine synthetase subunit TsaC/SUA5/YrdC